MTVCRYAARALAVMLAVALGGGCTNGAGTAGGEARGSASAPAAPSTPPASDTGVPRLAVDEVADGLAHPWDMGFLPDGSVLVTERGGVLKRLTSARPGASVERVAATLDDVGARGEGGLMGLVIDPDFATTRRFLTCQTHLEATRLSDVRVVSWTLGEDGASARRVKDLVTGLPVATGGRHSGCRMAIDASGALLIGTGDTAVGSIPQDRTSLGGKVLRVSLDTGEGVPDNPFASSANANERRVLSYGHRNIQGIALEADGGIVTAEHGPSFDDEVNRIRAGANYGWDPSRGGKGTAYDESVPMTDAERFPDAVPAIWTSGDMTEAICAVETLTGPLWTGHEGTLVVTALKGAKLLFLRPGADGAIERVDVPSATDGEFDRLRAARLGPDGALYVSTSNGTNDKILRITPTS